MSIIKHVTLQKIVAHDFRYDPRSTVMSSGWTPPGLLSDATLNFYSAFPRWVYKSFTVDSAAYIVDCSVSAFW